MYTVYNNNLSVHVSVTSNIIKVKPNSLNRQEKVKLFVQTASKEYLNLILDEVKDMELWEQRSLGFI